MRRFHRAPAILDAARHWRDRCLLDDGSILSHERLWTQENLRLLDRYYVQNPDASSRSFLDKLKDQIAPTPAQAKQLAAEILWLLYLGPSESALTGGTKRLHIKRIWDWSGERFPAGSPELQVLDRGMANPGTAYHTHKWREYAFAIELASAFKQLDRVEQNRLVDDAWAFAGWLESVQSSAGRQFRHFILALLFPDHFERIVTASDKQKVLRTFLPRIGGDAEGVDYRDRVAVDRALYSLREQMERIYDDDPLDYYLDAFRSEWKKSTTRISPKPDGNTEEAWYRERFGNARVWAISAGEGARMWDNFQEEQIAAIGWDYLGDLSDYGSREEIQAALRAQEGGNPTNNSLACWQFAHEMRPGDFVLLKQGRAIALGVGIVRSEYRYEDSRSEYQHVRDVDWQTVGRWFFPEGHSIATKTLTDFSPYKATLQRIFARIDRKEDRKDSCEDVVTLDDVAESIFLPREELVRIHDALGRKKNVILEGAPGVGKTFVARRLAWAWIGRKDDSRVEMVQFHQSYAYEDFVQGWRPRAEGGFELQDGIFHRFCSRAAQDPEHRYVFIIDEINRGNLSKVLGELMMLIEGDKRGSGFAIPLTYSRSLEERFYVPENVYVIGMMNTADRSLAMVDYALRRRFSFVRIPPAFSMDGFTNYLEEDGVEESLVERIVERMTELNRVIAEDTKNLGPGFEIGHSYFVPGPEEEGRDEAWYQRIVRQEIEPLLREYWFDQPQRVAEEIDRLLA